MIQHSKSEQRKLGGSFESAGPKLSPPIKSQAGQMKSQSFLTNLLKPCGLISTSRFTLNSPRRATSFPVSIQQKIKVITANRDAQPALANISPPPNFSGKTAVNPEGMGFKILPQPTFDQEKRIHASTWK